MHLLKHTNKKIVDVLESIENTFDPSGFIYRDINYWPAIRIRIAFRLMEMRYTEKGNRKASLFESIKVFFLKNKNYIPNKTRFDVLFVSHSNYKIDVGNITYDRVLDGYKRKCADERLTYAELNLENMNITFSELPDKIVCIKPFVLLIKMVSYCYSFYLSLKLSIIKMKVSEINNKLFSDFDGYQISEKEVTVYIAYLRVLQMFFRRLMNKAEVSQVYQAMYYDPVGLAINTAANELGVKKNCVQHGGQSVNNPFFGRWTNIPTNGYEMLPDTFICWDHNSADNILSWSRGLKKHTALVGGYKWAELWKNGLIQYDHIARIRKLSAGHYNILYTLQPSIGNIPADIRSIMNDEEINVRWWIRMHPRQVGKYLHNQLQTEFQGSTKVILDVATNEPLPAIMSVMDLHITSFSSSVYEALIFDVQTILVDESGREYFDDLIQGGKAKCILGRDHLKDYIAQQKKCLI